MATMEFSFGIEIEAIFFYRKALRQREPIPGSKGLFDMVDPLTVAGELLQSWSTPHKICPNPKVDNYDRWHITTDPSLFIHFGPEEKREMARSLIGEVDPVPEDWEHIGLDFVSPPFSISELSCIKSEIVILTRELTSDSCALTLTPKCGLHVHVGRSDNSLLPVPFLHDLMMSTLMYESEIGKLHAPHRRSNPQCLSNLGVFLTQKKDEKDIKYDEATGKTVQTVIYGVAELQKFVRSQQTHQELAGLMQPRTRIVNWDNIGGEEGKTTTIEFRQHDGTIDAAEIGHWVTFLSYLVSAVASGRELPQRTTWADNVTIEEVMAAMDLLVETRTYYQQKLRRYELEMVGQPEDNYASIWQPECATQ